MERFFLPTKIMSKFQYLLRHSLIQQKVIKLNCVMPNNDVLDQLLITLLLKIEVAKPLARMSTP